MGENRGVKKMVETSQSAWLKNNVSLSTRQALWETVLKFSPGLCSFSK